MKLFGKIIGVVAGYMVAGPVGAVLGLIVGHYFDIGYARQWMGGDVSKIQEAFFEATFSVMGHISKADGHVTHYEIQQAEAIMTQMRLSPLQRQHAIAMFTKGKQGNFNLDQALNKLLMVCRYRRDLLRIFLEIQFQAAYADSALNQREKEILQHICQRLGFTVIDFRSFASGSRAEYTYDQQRRQQRAPDPQQQLKNAYAILKLSPEASPAEIKKAYRRQMSQHHPDKLIAKGLPEEMMKLATKKTQEIKAAYDNIRKARGL